MSNQRILIRNENNNLFRICKIGLLTDKYKEEYIKFSFPDLKNKPAFCDEAIKIKLTNQGISEFSSHFLSGVSHFKTFKQERLKKNKSKNSFQNSELSHLLTYIIYDLKHFKKFTKKLANIDYEIENRFNPEKGKIFEFYISTRVDEIFRPAKKYSNLTPIQVHPFTVKKYRLLIIEYEFNIIDKSKNGITLFRKYNQKEKIIKINFRSAGSS